VSGTIQSAGIPLYIFPNGGGFKVGINVSLDNGTTFRMYEFDTGGTGFWAAYNPSWWANQPISSDITVDITYTSSITYTGQVVAEPVTFETTEGSQISVNSGNVVAIETAEKTSGGNAFTNAQWQADISATPVVPPLYGNFFGDFGMSLGTNSDGLFAILPQFSGTLAPLSNGFIIDLGPYPGSAGPIGANNYVQVGSVQVGLSAADILSFPFQVAMQGKNSDGGNYPGSNQPTYNEVLANGSLIVQQGSSSFATGTGIVFDTGAPSTTIHSGTSITEAGLGPFINGGTIGGNLSSGTGFTLTANGTNLPVPPGGMTADWLLSFLAGGESGKNQVNTTTIDVLNDTTGYVNTGLQPFFAGRVMFDLADGIIGFAPYDWKGSVALPNGFASAYPVRIQDTATITVPGLATIGGGLSGNGTIVVSGGTVALGGTNTNQGGITIGANATLDLAGSLAGGSGMISLGGVGATLRLDPGVVPTQVIGGLAGGNFIDFEGINAGTVAVAGTQLTVANAATAATVTLDGTYDASRFRATADGSGGTMITYVPPPVPYIVPIFSGSGTNLIVYAGLNGGPLNPYLLDSGSPNMFSTYGSWWPGYTEPVTQPGTNTFSFANGTTYYYDIVPTALAMGSGPGGTVVVAGANINVAQITNIGSATPAEDFANWASAVAQGNAPFGSDNTYGNFSAGLYGTSSLATALAQFPINDGLVSGFIIDALAHSGTAGSSAGDLTIGLAPTEIALWKADPSVIVLAMAATGTTLPNPAGNAVAAPGYDKAQIADATLSLTMNGTTTNITIPAVFDTGGGANNIIYNPGGVPDLTAFQQPGEDRLLENISLNFNKITTAGTLATILQYLTGPGALPTGGQTEAIASTSIPGTLRINPGLSLFLQYEVMFDLEQGEVLLRPAPCFAAGTMIETTQGMVAVEDLTEGDLLVTHFAAAPQPVRWIGRRRVDCAHHPDRAAVDPIRIAPGAFGPGQPARALYLSPDHAVYFDGVLIPVRRLVNGTTITRAPRDSVTYYHVELPAHDVIRAEGLAVESYLDSGDRDSFDNGLGAIRLHPSFGPRTPLLAWEAAACAPLVVHGPELERARLATARTGSARRHSARPGR